MHKEIIATTLRFLYNNNYNVQKLITNLWQKNIIYMRKGTTKLGYIGLPIQLNTTIT